MASSSDARCTSAWLPRLSPRLRETAVHTLRSDHVPPPSRFADAHSAYMLCCWDHSYDIVTAAGDLIRVAPTGQHAELFRALPWSYGTLGVLVAAELRLIRVPTPYVRLSVSASCQPVPMFGCE